MVKKVCVVSLKMIVVLRLLENCVMNVQRKAFSVLVENCVEKEYIEEVLPFNDHQSHYSG